MKNLLRTPVIVNAALFQALWFACVLGGAARLIWPALVLGAVMLVWQLHPARRHDNDIIVLLAALIMGIVVDSIWIISGAMQFTDIRPIAPFAPAFIIIMWLGFALTINHSMAWLASKSWLPPVMGLIGGPMAYLAGARLGAVEFLIDTWIICALLGIVWAIALTILVKLGQIGLRSSEFQLAR